MANSYSQHDKERAVAAFVGSGTIEKSSEITGIKACTIYKWRERHPEEWERMVEKVWSDVDDVHRAEINDCFMAGIRVAKDGLENGNERINTKTGEKIRVQVPAKDAATIAGIMFDKLRLSLGKPATIQAGKVQSPQDRLQELRDAAKKHGIESGKVVEIQG